MVWQIVGVLVEVPLVAAGSVEVEAGYLEDRYFAELAEVY